MKPDVDLASIRTPDELVKLTDHYVSPVCFVFVDQFGPSIFESEAFKKMNKPGASHRLLELDEEGQEKVRNLLSACVNYYVCDLLLTRKQKLIDLFSDFLALREVSGVKVPDRSPGKRTRNV